MSEIRPKKITFFAKMLHFIQSFLLPNFVYNAEIWFCSSTDGEKDKFNEFFSNIGFYDNLQEKLHECILKFSNHFTFDNRHVLNIYFVSILYEV